MPDEATPKGIIQVDGRAIEWLSGQTPITVLLFLILAGLGYFAVYLIKYAIPSHLTQIQTGYREVTEMHARESKMWRALCREMAKLPPEPESISAATAASE